VNRHIRKALLVLAGLAGGCGGNDFISPAKLISREIRGSVTSNGVERTFSIFLPTGHDSGAAAPAPLVLALHGIGMNASSMSWLTGLDMVAERHGFVVVYPEAKDGNWNEGVIGGDTDDVGFIRDLLDQLLGTYRIDPRRVYVTGLSKGGYMANRLAIELSDRIAAVAPVSAVLSQGLVGNASGGRPVPVMIIEGDSDPILSSVTGIVEQFGQIGGAVLSALQTVNFWINHNRTSTEPIVTYDEDRDPNDGTRVRRSVYPPRDGSGAEVILLTVEGGGHGWPGGLNVLPEAIFGKMTKDMSAGEAVWEFFSQHTLP
jgi:polyhydroxybutyrate depolymerase